MWSVLPLINLIFLRLLCSSEVGVYAYAAAQVKKAMEVGVYSYITLRGYIVYFVHLDYSYIDLSSDNCFICCFVHPIGDSLSRGRKLCLLGWSWGLSITLEHRYGKRAWSSGMFVRHFLLWYSGKLCFSMWALVSFMLLKRFTYFMHFSLSKVFQSFQCSALVLINLNYWYLFWQAKFLEASVANKKKIGFNGNFPL